MRIPESLSRQLITVAFVATVLVVMCHCDDYMTNKDGVVSFIGGVFTDANVANFFFLSGFFVARHFGEEGWWRKAVSSRLCTLGIPYLSWCVVYLGVYCLVWLLGCYQPPAGMFSLKSIFGIGLLTPPIDFALWYIKTLFYFIVISPLFFVLQHKFRVAFPLIALLMLIVKMSVLGSSPLLGFCFNIVGFACFLMGAEVVFSNSMHRIFFSKANTEWGVIWLFCWLITAFLVNCASGCLRMVLQPIYVLFAVFCLQRIVANFHWRVGEMFAKSSFVIYAAHLLILKLTSPILNKLLGEFPILCFVMMTIVSVGGGIAVTISLRKMSRRILSLLTGGRG